MMSKIFAFLLLLACTSFAVAQNANVRRNYRVLNVGMSGKGGGKGGAKGGSSGKGSKKTAMHSKSSKKMKHIVEDMEDMVFGSMSM